MDQEDIRALFDRQKERLRLAIKELSELRDTMEGSRRESLEATLSRLHESLADDEQTSAKLEPYSRHT